MPTVNENLDALLLDKRTQLATVTTTINKILTGGEEFSMAHISMRQAKLSELRLMQSQLQAAIRNIELIKAGIVPDAINIIQILPQ